MTTAEQFALPPTFDLVFFIGHLCSPSLSPVYVQQLSSSSSSVTVFSASQCENALNYLLKDFQYDCNVLIAYEYGTAKEDFPLF